MLVKLQFGILLGVLLSSTACQNAADQQEHANEAQLKANQETLDLQNKATEAAARLQREADQKIAEAQATFSKLREDYRHTVASNLVNLDEDIAKLSSKAKDKRLSVRTATEKRLTEIREKRTEFQQEFSSLEAAGAKEWDAARAALEKEWDNLKALVSKDS
jgi:leucyl aminopeptidase (aminopeptidase T)